MGIAPRTTRFLDFGGQIKGGPRRPYLRRGRYIYNAFFTKRDEFEDAMSAAIVKVARDAGIEVT